MLLKIDLIVNKWRRFAVILISAGAVLAEWGCGVYSFSGSAYPHIKSIAIPLFEDRTAEFGVRENLTNALVEAFTRDNTLKIADRRNADAILEGVLMRVEDRPGAYNRQEQVQEIQVFLTVQIKYRDLKKRKIIWEDTISQFGTYTPGGSENSTREDAISEAIAKIADEVLNRTVSGW